MDQIQNILRTSGATFQVEAATSIRDIIHTYLSSDKIQITFNPTVDDVSLDDDDDDSLVIPI